MEVHDRAKQAHQRTLGERIDYEFGGIVGLSQYIQIITGGHM